jgi:DNA gyrase subunit A
LSVLKDNSVLKKVINDELDSIKEQFDVPRRTEINEGEVSEIDQEDLVQRSDMVVSVTNSGYIKRVPLNMYRPRKEEVRVELA